MKSKKRILVAPLDWGLGHATRCIPIINSLIKSGLQVILATNGASLTLLREQFPGLESFDIAAYDPFYGAESTIVKDMTMQLPKFIKAIAQEHEDVEAIVKTQGIDIVLSDNRYGAYSKQVKSVFVGHQIQILMPAAWKWMEKLVNYQNHQQLKAFSECWIPAPDASLIKPLITDVKGLNTRYIGYLSRLKKVEAESKYDVLVICSGPQPQRGVFESKLMEQLQGTSLKSLVLRGEPGNATTTVLDNLTVVNFMNMEQLNLAIAQSKMIVARSGYSTIMDLMKTEKKAIFVPTPGQTEQEHLAGELMRRKVAYFMPQSDFNLTKALKEGANYSGFMNFEQDDTLLTSAIQSLL